MANRVRSLLPLLCLLVILAVAGAWSAYWFVTRGLIDDEIARHDTLLQARGGSFDCAEPTWSGFPTRVTFTCPGSVLALPDGPVFETTGLEVSAPLYRPGQAVAVASAPTKVRMPSGNTVTIEHSPLKLAIDAGPAGEPSAVAAVERIAVDTGHGWSFSGRSLALEGARLSADELAFAASGQDLTLARGNNRLVGLAMLAVRGRIEGLPDGPRIDPKALVRQAVRQGSRVTIEAFEAQLASVVLTAEGSVRLSPKGPTGTLTTTVSNLDAFLSELEERGAISRKGAQAATLLIGLLQGDRSDGAVSVDLRFHDGRVYWGPFAIAEIPRR